MASPARFERAAFRLGGECSILLSYGDRWNRITSPPYTGGDEMQQRLFSIEGSYRRRSPSASRDPADRKAR